MVYGVLAKGLGLLAKGCKVRTPMPPLASWVDLPRGTSVDLPHGKFDWPVCSKNFNIIKKIKNG